MECRLPPPAAQPSDRGVRSFRLGVGSPIGCEEALLLEEATVLFFLQGQRMVSEK